MIVGGSVARNREGDPRVNTALNSTLHAHAPIKKERWVSNFVIRQVSSINIKFERWILTFIIR